VELDFVHKLRRKIMIYAIGYRDFSPERVHIVNIQKHITKEEYDNHITMLGVANKINAMENVHNLLNRNGKEFLLYSSQIKEYLEVDEESICLEANRLLINYLSS
jgi:16S rRNA G527 N7-methylase RsmG